MLYNELLPPPEEHDLDDFLTLKERTGGHTNPKPYYSLYTVFQGLT